MALAGLILGYLGVAVVLAVALFLVVIVNAANNQ